MRNSACLVLPFAWFRNGNIIAIKRGIQKIVWERLWERSNFFMPRRTNGMRKGNWHMGSRRKEAELYQTGEKCSAKAKYLQRRGQRLVELCRKEEKMDCILQGK